MPSLIQRSIALPVRTELTWHEAWASDDRGLMKCWENGRATAILKPELAGAARRGELPPLHWKGGIAGTPKMKKKYGCLFYLATWQGLRGDDLSLDLERDVPLVCSRTGIAVTFTADLSKLDSDSDEAASEEPRDS
jgi:hypothetical protein